MKEPAFLYISFVTWLLLVWPLQRVLPWRGRLGLLVACAVAAALLFVRWFGHPLPYWSFGLSANFSVIMTALLVLSIAARSSGREVLRARDWRAAWVFGVAACLAVCPSAFGMGPQCFDAYSLGWPWLFPYQSLALFAGVSLVSAALIWRGNRFGYVLLAALLAYASGFQESENLWDYLLDPVYGAASLLGALWMGRARWRARTSKGSD